MRNRALSVLRARQLIINNAASMPCKQLIVLTWALVTSGEPHVRGCPRNSCTKGETVGSATFPSSIVSCSRA